MENLLKLRTQILQFFQILNNIEELGKLEGSFCESEGRRFESSRARQEKTMG